MITPLPGVVGRIVLDVSHWESLMDHARVATELRALDPERPPKVIFKVSDGQHFGDPLYAYNVRRFRDVGVEIGTYHFVRPLSDAASQLRVYHAALYGAFIEEPFQPGMIALDMESAGGLGRTTVRRHAIASIRFVLSEFQTIPEIYTRMSWWNAYVGPVNWQAELGIDAPPLWAADYGYNWIGGGISGPRWIRNWRTWRRWQYTAKGRVPGITGEVDLNIER